MSFSPSRSSDGAECVSDHLVDKTEKNQMNIYQRINEVRKAIGYVRKDKSVSTGDGNYKAVTHDQVTGMLRNALIDHGVIIVPTTTYAVFHAREPEAKRRLYEATYDIAFVNMESPDDRIVMTINAHAMDNGDKAPGKAISYATKYAMLKLCAIETGEDDESRYQMDSFDVGPHVESIHSATMIDELKTLFQSAYREAIASGDKNAMKELMSAKDARKRALEQAK